jgi:hypothetical protein
MPVRQILFLIYFFVRRGNVSIRGLAVRVKLSGTVISYMDMVTWEACYETWKRWLKVLYEKIKLRGRLILSVNKNMSFGFICTRTMAVFWFVTLCGLLEVYHFPLP